MTDSAFVGRLGAAELGGIGFATIWGWTFFCVFSGCATGVQTFVSQAHGAGRDSECGAWAWRGLWAVVLPATLSYALFGLLAEPFLGALGATDEVKRHAVAYQHVRPLGIPALAAWIVLASFFRGLGDTRTPLVTTVVANVVNAVLAYGLVFGRLGLPAWGVAGAALASSLSEWLEAAMLFAVLLRRAARERYDTGPRRFERDAVFRFLRTSVPIGGQWLLDMSAFAIFTTLVARMGTAAMAANQAMLSLLSLSFMQAYGVGLATSTLVGRYKGAREPEAAERSLASALRLGGGVTIAVAALFVLAPEALLSIYTRDAAVLALGRPLLSLGAAFQLFDALGIIVGGALRGAGDTRWPFVIQTLGAWALRLPLVWLFAITLGYGIVGAWCAEFVFVTTLGLAFLVRFRGGAWRHVAI
jgi:MATE family multidrug resistance protein